MRSFSIFFDCEHIVFFCEHIFTEMYSSLLHWYWEKYFLPNISNTVKKSTLETVVEEKQYMKVKTLYQNKI